MAMNNDLNGESLAAKPTVALRDAIESASQWSGCGWTTQHGRTQIDLDGVSAAAAGGRAADLDDLVVWLRDLEDAEDVSIHDESIDEVSDDDLAALRRAASALEAREDFAEDRALALAEILAADWRSAADWLVEVEQSARRCEELAGEVLEAAQRDAWDEAFETAKLVRDEETRWGDAPCWGRLPELVRAAAVAGPVAAVAAAADLDDLCAAMRWLDDVCDLVESAEEDHVDLPGLPIFGGEAPDDTALIWSWDACRMLVVLDDGTWTVCDREDDKRLVRCACGEWSGEPCGWTGPPEEITEIEFMPRNLRDTHTEAHNRGRWPMNGAVRIWVSLGCAGMMRETDPDWTELLDDGLDAQLERQRKARS